MRKETPRGQPVLAHYRSKKDTSPLQERRRVGDEKSELEGLKTSYRVEMGVIRKE